ncbi:MAG: DUF362 domain-containing protein [Clostridiales bacterium]|nr:DUF362 domain-containing protein [Clostridiales bacterium]
MEMKKSKVLFSSVLFDRYDADVTLPAKFKRLLSVLGDEMGLFRAAEGKNTVIKMHVGRNIGYSTIHPLFVKILIDSLLKYKANVYITDQDINDAKVRGYTEEYLGVPVVPVCGVTGKYIYKKKVEFKTLRHVDIGGNVHDADVFIDLSHVKGHGGCGFGGGCKNIAMGCVTDRTRREIHSLEGGINWDEDLCTHCEACIGSCNHNVNKFDEQDRYHIFYHHCTYCQHCIKVCPTGALSLDMTGRYEDFQTGMAVCTEEVLKVFKPENIFFINFLLNITAICDCWGLTTPALVPDIGVMAGTDLVAVEKACIDAIKVENLISSGIPQGFKLKEDGHLFDRLHGKNPFVQLRELSERGLGNMEYEIAEVG